jgi:pectate lyase
MPKIFRVLPCFCLLVSACGGSGSSVKTPDASPGGSAGTSAPGSGGITQTGGLASAGGTTDGSKPVGGTVASAGTAGASTTSGGAISGAGTTAPGGTQATAGTSEAGGTTTMGGTAMTGGIQANGGSTSMGGTTAAGGSKAPGGTTAAGGSNTTGGTTAAGGSKTAGSTATTGGSSATGGTGGSGAGSGGATTAGASAAGTRTGGSAGSGAGGAAGASASTGAPETSPLGYGKATTGGGSVSAMTVADMAAMQAAIDAYSGSGGLVLKYTGQFNFASIPDPCVQHTLPAQTIEIKKKSNITILGADGSAANFGIHIASSSSNIIIRNMTIGLTPGGGDSDMISLEGMSGGIPTDIWIDHNELFSSMLDCAGAGDTSFDGMIDIKKGADNVTISYNYMHDHHKVSMNGYSDDDSAVRHVTFHHNLFENVGSRTPLQRFGYSHMLNNYLYKVLVSGINVRMGGYSLVEANYFETVLNPVTARDSTAIGYWDLRNNNLASKADVSAGNAFGVTWDAGNSGTVNATDWTTTAAFPGPLGYTYTPDPFQCVHDGLRAVAGAGKGLATLKCK